MANVVTTSEIGVKYESQNISTGVQDLAALNKQLEQTSKNLSTVAFADAGFEKRIVALEQATKRAEKAMREHAANVKAGVSAGKQLQNLIPEELFSKAKGSQLGQLQQSIKQVVRDIEAGKTTLASAQGKVGSKFNLLGTDANSTIALTKLKDTMVAINPPTATFNKQMGDLFTKLGNYALIYGTYQAFNTLSSGITKGVSDAADYIIKINEIRSINQEGGQSFDFISNKVTNLSQKFGLPALDVAEGAYQALSNQIGKGAEAFNFLDTAAKFSVASVSSMTDSVNLLSSAIKAYQLPVTDAERVSAILFKGIEVGRFRAAELAPVFGRLANTGRELGVSLEEVTGTLATFTIQGTRVTEATTLLNNIMLSLIKPSKEMKKFFGEEGFASPKAALDALGFVGVLKLFNEQLDKSPQRIAAIAGNVRTLRGILATGGKSFDEIKTNIDSARNSQESFANAVDINLNNAGRQFKAFQESWVNGWRIVGEAIVPVLNNLQTLALKGFQQLPTGSGLNVGQVQQLQAINAAAQQAIDGFSARNSASISKTKQDLDEIAKILQTNLAASIKGTAQELSRVTEGSEAVKRVVSDRKALFFEELKTKIKATTDEASKAKSAIEAIRGTQVSRGALSAVAGEQASFNLDQSVNRPTDNSKFRQIALIRAEMERITKLGSTSEWKQIFESGNAANQGQGRTLVQKQGLAGNTVEEIKDQTARLIQLANQLEPINERAVGKRSAYLQKTEQINKAYELEKSALEQIAQKNEAIRVAKTAEAEAQKAQLKNIESSLDALNKFDPTKSKDPKQELANILGDLGKNADLFKQDPAFNTALQTRLALLQQQIGLQESITKTQEREVAAIESGRKAGQIKLEQLRAEQQIQENLAISRARSLADNLINGKDAQGNPLKGGPFGRSDRGGTEEVTATAKALQDFLESGGKDAKGILEALPLLQTDLDRISDPVYAKGLQSIKDELSGLYTNLNRGRSAQIQIEQTTADAAASLDKTAKGFGDVNTQANPVIQTMQTYSGIAGGAKTVTDALTISVKNLAAALALVSGRTNTNVPAVSDAVDPVTGEFWGGQTFAHGGRGSDKIRALLSRGEFVMNRRASTQFAPQLAAMNSGRVPSTFASGGPANVTNVGDVNITVSNGTSSSQTARSIGVALKREIRRGALR